MSIQAVSFGKQAVTKNGNVYDKTNLGGKVGAAVGAGYATYAGIKTAKLLKSIDANALGDMYRAVQGSLPQEAKATLPKFKDFAQNAIKSIRKATPIGIAIYAGIAILAGFGIGKLTDFVVNKVRAKKADAQNV